MQVIVEEYFKAEELHAEKTQDKHEHEEQDDKGADVLQCLEDLQQ